MFSIVAILKAIFHELLFEYGWPVALCMANGRGSVSYRGVLFAGELPGGLPITETPISKNLV